MDWTTLVGILYRVWSCSYTVYTRYTSYMHYCSMAYRPDRLYSALVRTKSHRLSLGMVLLDLP